MSALVELFRQWWYWLIVIPVIFATFYTFGFHTAWFGPEELRWPAFWRTLKAPWGERSYQRGLEKIDRRIRERDRKYW